MNLTQYLSNCQTKGRYTFSKSEAHEALSERTYLGLTRALWRLKKKGELAETVKGFFVIVPPEYRALGCLPAIQMIFELMKFLDKPYYIALLSAAEFYSAAHQKPQVLQVITNKPQRSIRCGRVSIDFIVRKDLQKMPLRSFKTPRGFVQVSSPETTAMDLVTYPAHGAGLNNVLTVLMELGESIKPEALSKLAKASHEGAWIQRLGYLLEHAGYNSLAEVLFKQLRHFRIQNRYLLPAAPTQDAPVNSKWHLFINAELEADL